MGRIKGRITVGGWGRDEGGKTGTRKEGSGRRQAALACPALRPRGLSSLLVKICSRVISVTPLYSVCARVRAPREQTRAGRTGGWETGAWKNPRLELGLNRVQGPSAGL